MKQWRVIVTEVVGALEMYLVHATSLSCVQCTLVSSGPCGVSLCWDAGIPPRWVSSFGSDSFFRYILLTILCLGLPTIWTDPEGV